MNARFFSLYSFLVRVDPSDPHGTALVRNGGSWVRSGLHNDEVPLLGLAHKLSEAGAVAMARELDREPVSTAA